MFREKCTLAKEDGQENKHCAIFDHEGRWSAGVGSKIDDYRIRGEQPMNPGESRSFTSRDFIIPANYAKGVTYPQGSTIARSILMEPRSGIRVSLPQ